MGTAVTWRAGCVAVALLSLAGCGGGGQADARAVVVCASGDLACQARAAGTAARSCVVMPAGWRIYMDDINDAQLRYELQRVGVWEVGNWIEGEGCE
jgi:hypothetical protein